MDADELKRKIQEEDPTYDPKIRRIKPEPDITNIVPVSYLDMKSETPPPLEYIFSPCLPTQGIAFIYAPTGVGKTLFTLNLAYAIAGGGNFLKYSCPKPRKVLYVDGEMPYGQLHSRIMQIAKMQGDLHFEENFKVLTPDKILPFRVPMLDNEFGQELYLKLIEHYGFEVIIFDNLSMLSSFDENKSHEWKPIQDWILYLRSIGKTIIIIHHAGKEKTGYRGTSRMLDCADVAISLQPVTDDTLEEENIAGRKFKIVYQKSRVFGGKDALPFEVNLENAVWTFKSMEQTDMDKVIDLYGMKMSQRDMAKDLGLALSKVNRLIKKAKDLGLIRD
jgi:KaiC/GvpD/RAD55 family RecA-like ATPase